MFLHWHLGHLSAPLLIMFIVIGAGSLLEWFAHAGVEVELRQFTLNTMHGMLANVVRVGLAPGLGIATTAIINASGGGWIPLPDHGWALVLSAVFYLLAIDFSEFLFHRAQHAIPFLWEMHSFHHSDPSVNVTTSFRNYWLETPIKILFVYPWVAILFQVPPPVTTVYAVSTVWHAVNHLNVRWRSPIPWFLLNNWQFHRIHHSALREHWDTNFSPYFPIWDVLGGTAYAPKPGEYPPTGLPKDNVPATFREALLWPWRERPARPLPLPARADTVFL